MFFSWRRQQGSDAFTRRISDFSEDKRRRMPANVKTYDGTGDPDDHLKIFESAATIENWPQPVSIDGFEELRRAFRLNFTQRKKCAKNPVELARVKQRQGESTSVYVERYKDECIHLGRDPEILKDLRVLHSRRSRRRGQQKRLLKQQVTGTIQETSQRPESSRMHQLPRSVGRAGTTSTTHMTMTPKELLATELKPVPKTTSIAHSGSDICVGNGYCEYHRQKGHTTNECVQLRQLIDKLVKEGRLDHLVKNIKEGKDKQRGGGKKEHTGGQG
ncbi:hypothetical protein Tco_0215524 [Tanacetum coccineum]